MKTWICMLLAAVLLFSLAACGKTETDQPSGDTTVSQSDFTTEDTRPSESGTEEETESVKAELQYNIGYYAFEDIGTCPYTHGMGFAVPRSRLNRC